jgi:hypothetical protein
MRNCQGTGEGGRMEELRQSVKLIVVKLRP